MPGKIRKSIFHFSDRGWSSQQCLYNGSLVIDQGSRKSGDFVFWEFKNNLWLTSNTGKILILHALLLNAAVIARCQEMYTAITAVFPEGKWLTCTVYSSLVVPGSVFLSASYWKATFIIYYGCEKLSNLCIPDCTFSLFWVLKIDSFYVLGFFFSLLSILQGK